MKLPTLPAISYGPEVAALAHEGGEVYGVTGKGAYLHARGGALVGLVDSRGVDGPVTLRVLGLDGVLGDLQSSHGRPFIGNGSTLQIAGILEIDLKLARQWIPPTVHLGADSKSIRETTQVLRDVISTHGARSGLGPLVDYGYLWPFRHRDAEFKIQEPLLRLAGRSLEALVDAWRAGSIDNAREAAVKLLGLGPGLTPSGDDLLAGLLAACGWAHQRLDHVGRQHTPEIHQAIVQGLISEAPTRTTHLSARLLAYAADGILYEPAMSLGVALFAGSRTGIEPAALNLFTLGHTSGTDMAVGILLGAALTFE
jgi:hypothetical protein